MCWRCAETLQEMRWKGAKSYVRNEMKMHWNYVRNALKVRWNFKVLAPSRTFSAFQRIQRMSYIISAQSAHFLQKVALKRRLHLDPGGDYLHRMYLEIILVIQWYRTWFSAIHMTQRWIALQVNSGSMEVPALVPKKYRRRFATEWRF